MGAIAQMQPGNVRESHPLSQWETVGTELVWGRGSIRWKDLWERSLERLGGGDGGGTVLQMEPMASCILRAHSTTEPHSGSRSMEQVTEFKKNYSLWAQECHPQQEFPNHSSWYTGQGGTCKKKAYLKAEIWSWEIFTLTDIVTETGSMRMWGFDKKRKKNKMLSWTQVFRRKVTPRLRARAALSGEKR